MFTLPMFGHEPLHSVLIDNDERIDLGVSFGAHVSMQWVHGSWADRTLKVRA